MNTKEFNRLMACCRQDKSGRLVSSTSEISQHPEAKSILANSYSKDEALEILRIRNNEDAPKEKQVHVAHEENMHMRIVRLMAETFPEYSPMLVHNANEFKGTVSQGAKRKALGVRKGFPDFSFYIPTPYYHGLHIELKYGKNKQSEEQKYYEQMLTKYGYQYVVCKSEEEFIKGINQYIILGRWGTADEAKPAKKAVNYMDLISEE